MCGWVVVEPVSLGCWGCRSQVNGRARYPRSTVRSGANPSECRGSYSPMMGAALLLQCPVRGRASEGHSPWISPCMVPMDAVVTWATDINTEYRCISTKDPDIAFSCSSGLDVTMALGGSTGHSDQRGSRVALPSYTNMDSDG